MSAKQAETVVESGTEIFIPLSRLKKCPKNARKMPHGETAIEALAAGRAIVHTSADGLTDAEHSAVKDAEGMIAAE